MLYWLCDLLTSGGRLDGLEHAYTDDWQDWVGHTDGWIHATMRDVSVHMLSLSPDLDDVLFLRCFARARVESRCRSLLFLFLFLSLPFLPHLGLYNSRLFSGSTYLHTHFM